MPEITVWPVSSSERTWKVGSSSPSRWSATDSFSWSTLVFGSIERCTTGSSKVIASSTTGASGRGQRVAGGGLLDADAGGDVARVDLLDLLAAVRVHHQDAPDALGAAGDGVEHAPAGLELAGVDAEVGELADVGVGHDLERERREGLVVGGLAHDRVAVGVHALDRRDVERAGQVVDDRVEQRLHALVLEGGAAQHGGDRDVEGRLADVGDQPVGLDRLLLEVVLHQLVVVLGDGLDQLRARLRGGVLELGGDVGDLPLLAEVVLVDDRLHVHEVDDAA